MWAASETSLVPELAPAVFYDGETARPHAVTLRFDAQAVEMLEAGGAVAHWPYDSIRRIETGGYLLRLRSAAAPALARLDIHDEALKDELIRRCARLDADARRDRRGVAKIVAWSLAAAVSLVLTVVYLVPIVADELAPLIPPPLEQRLGEAVDNQVRVLFGGKVCEGAPGQTALAKLSAKLAAGLDLPLPAEIAVLDTSVPNAIALPGGRVYLFNGLLQRANAVDEIAGVLAHEIGHVKGRDGLRKLIQTGGSAFLLGLLFGDVTGGGALILVGRMLTDSSYSREAERGADRVAADVMLSLGRSPKPMGAFLLRVTGSQKDDRFPFLANHPVSEDRLAALSAREPQKAGPPLLTEEEWRALKSICRSG
jgi:predicted Zn-dependent protease